ncbi:hypothetical protein OF83DRAFT_1140753, partial [Amylostereum chailletii]
MPLLTSSFTPPMPSPSSATSSETSSTHTSRSGSARSLSSTPTSPERGTRPDAKSVAGPSQDLSTDETKTKKPCTLKIPTVMLQTPVISDDMAASLAVSLLGHVLFLKSQVPFPVAQLMRLPPSSNARAAKKRAELVNAFDELSSHLHTTFTALSTAFAKNKTRYPLVHSGAAPEVAPTMSAHLVFLVGPTVGAPKARVVLSVDGLEVKAWGEREREDAIAEREQEDGESEEDAEDSEDGSEEEADLESDCQESDSGSRASSPPLSDPSLSRSSSPRSSSPPSPPLRVSLSPKTLPANRATQPHLTSPPQVSRAEQQQALRAAERLLSRTLANAYAEGGGMAVEMAPSHTHILLHAPRRFVHPAWNPRQNATSSLDNMLSDFFVESGLRPGAVRARKTGVKTEGVYVGCGAGRHAGDEQVAQEDEEDEMIWWMWDGKLTGFAE